MILDHAILHIKRGQPQAFEVALKKVRPLSAAIACFLKREYRPYIKRQDRYA